MKCNKEQIIFFIFAEVEELERQLMNSDESLNLGCLKRAGGKERDEPRAGT